MIRCAPGGREPRLQGKPPAHGSLTTGEDRPARVGSVTTTSVAVDGPRLPTTIPYVTVSPLRTSLGPVFSISRFAWRVSSVRSVAVLFARLGSTTLDAGQLSGSRSGPITRGGGHTVAGLLTGAATAGGSGPVAGKTARPPAGRV